MNIKNNKEKLSIIIPNTASKKEHSNKEAIDKKIKKIELLTKQVNDIKEQIYRIKELFTEHLEKDEKLLFETKEKLVLKLYDRYQQKAFSNWQKDFIINKIQNEIIFFVENNKMTTKISEIHEEITLFQQQALNDDEKEMMNDMAKEMFKNLGIDIDEENFDYNDFSNEEFRTNFEKEYQQQNAENQHKELSDKNKGRTTDKDFQKLYRELVKKTHPDLVKDTVEKEKREELMKKLSQAWEDRNYYQLLILQNEIDADSTFEVSLNGKQLKAMINQLNKEIRNMEAEKYHLKKFDTQNAFYYQNFNAKSEKGILKKIEEYKKHILFDVQETKNEITELKTQKSTKELLNKIRSNNQLIDDSFLDQLNFF